MICSCGAKARLVSDLDAGQHLVVPDPNGSLYISTWTREAVYVERISEPGYDGARVAA
jgi:hypothetical protein